MKNVRFATPRREVWNKYAGRVPTVARLAWLTRTMRKIVADENKTPEARAKATMLIKALNRN
jgi:hypothetical protein